jgi:hypothetical protein
MKCAHLRQDSASWCLLAARPLVLRAVSTTGETTANQNAVQDRAYRQGR